MIEFCKAKLQSRPLNKAGGRNCGDATSYCAEFDVVK